MGLEPIAVIRHHAVAALGGSCHTNLHAVLYQPFVRMALEPLGSLCIDGLRRLFR